MKDICGMDVFESTKGLVKEGLEVGIREGLARTNLRGCERGCIRKV